MRHPVERRDIPLNDVTSHCSEAATGLDPTRFGAPGRAAQSDRAHFFYQEDGWC